MLILVSEFHLLEKRYLIISCWNVIQTSGWHTAKKGILKTELKIKKKKTNADLKNHKLISFLDSLGLSNNI